MATPTIEGGTLRPFLSESECFPKALEPAIGASALRSLVATLLGVGRVFGAAMDNDGQCRFAWGGECREFGGQVGMDGCFFEGIGGGL